MLNKVQLIGRLGRKPELRYTQGNKAVCSFSVATDDSFGENKTTTWHDVVAWETTAENSAKYLDKGSLVYVEGRIQKRKYTAKDGSERTAVEVVAAIVRFLDKKGQREEEREAAPPRREDRQPSYRPEPISTNQRNGPHGDWSREQTDEARRERKAGAAVDEPPPDLEELPF